MAKFNEKNSDKTVNHEYYSAYTMTEKEHLISAVLTTFFREYKYYGSNDDEIIRLAIECAKTDPSFLCNLTCYARNEFNLRSISHVLACIIAHEAHEYTRAVIRNIIVRPDDITEIMACWLEMYGKPFPNALKKEIACQLQRFDEYSLAKYNSRYNSMRFRDVLCITHPKPKDKATEELFRKVLENTLETPYTWETELSARGNKKEVWDELIASGKVGYMALLRNLRNIIQSGADIKPVLKIISSREQVLKSRQMPFRFYSAYATLNWHCLMTSEIHSALEKALVTSVENMEPIRGRTLIAVDVSGSMGNPLSAKSIVTCGNIGVLLGAISSRLCDDATVCYFNAAEYYGKLNEQGYIIKKYLPTDSILEICHNDANFNGCTQMDLPMNYALNVDENRFSKPFDRIIYLSDNECNASDDGLDQPVQKLVNEYRKTYNRDFWVHAIDLQGYGTQQFKGDKFNLISGWNEKILSFVNLAEQGLNTLINTIQEYQIK